MLLRYFSFIVCGIFVSGCATENHSPRSSEYTRPALSVEDYYLSEALAHYCNSLILEYEKGAESRDALDHLIEAIKLDPSQPALYTRAANIHIQQKHYDEAIKLLQSAVRKTPDSLTARVYLANTYEIAGHIKQAINEYSRAINLSPKTASLYITLSKLYFKQENGSKAMDTLKKGLKKSDKPSVILLVCYNIASNYLNEHQKDKADPWIDILINYDSPKKPQFCDIIGQLFENTGYEKEALDQYNYGLALDPGNSKLHINLANYFFNRNQDSEALDTIKTALTKADNPNAIVSFCSSIGMRFYESKETDRAIRCFETIMHNDPLKLHFFYELLGELYESTGNNEKAISYLKLATEANNPESSAFLKLSALYMKTGQSLAKETLTQAASLKPDDPNILFSLGCLYSYEKQFDKAIITFQKTEEIARKTNKDVKLNAEFYLQYGAAYEKSGQLDKAETVLEKCINLYPENHEALNYLAYMWAEQNIKLDKGLEYINRALKLESNNGAYIDTLGWIYYKQRKYKEALQQIQNASNILENDPTIADHLGDVLNSLDNKNDAITCWKESFMLDPNNETVANKLKINGVNVERLREQSKKDISRQDETTQ